MKVHMSLPTRNLEETIKFYSILFGEQPVKQKTDYVKFDPQSTSFNLSFHLVDPESEFDASRHLGFEMASQLQLDSIHKRLQSEGLISQEKQESVCCYANQDKFWVEDPSGFRWEIYTLLEDTSAKMDNKTACCAGDQLDAKSKCC